MTVADRRRRWREDARRRRAAELDGKRRGAARCPKRMGSSTCGGPLRTSVGAFGQTIITCEWCDRQEAGICRECPRPVDGQRRKALRCARCKQVERNRATRRHAELHHQQILEKSRAYYRDSDEVRRRRNEYKKAWRKAHPEKVREQKRRYVERHRADPNSRYNRYHAKYRKRHHEYHRTAMRQRYRSQHAAPIGGRCTKCGKPTRWTPIPGVPSRPWSKCNKCCWPCERRRRRRIRAAALRAIAIAEPMKPARVVPPKAPARRGPGDERLCISPGCDVVVTHRKKKCSRCRERDRQVAGAALDPFRGRGHRTDLDRQERVA